MAGLLRVLPHVPTPPAPIPALTQGQHPQHPCALAESRAHVSPSSQGQKLILQAGSRSSRATVLLTGMLRAGSRRNLDLKPPNPSPILEHGSNPTTPASALGRAGLAQGQVEGLENVSRASKMPPEQLAGLRTGQSSGARRLGLAGRVETGARALLDLPFPDGN